MATDKQDKVLNVPNKREQSQTCLNSAERAGLRPKGNVPTLRFPEFTEEWTECELQDIASISKGAGISKDQLSDTGEPCILYGELYTKYKSEVITDVLSKTDIDTTNLVRSKANDVIIPSSGETAIDISTARCVPYDSILLGGDLNIIRLKNQDGRFYSYQLNGVRKLDIAQIAQGVSVVHLYGESLKRLQVRFPSKSEQEKISSSLSAIDERIATQIRIIDKLKSLMRGLNNELMDNPRWAKIYVGDFIEFFSTNSLSWDQLSYDYGQVCNLHYGLIHSGLPTLVDCQKVHLPYIKEGSLPKQYVICKNGDVAFADASEDTTEVGKAVELINIENQNVVCGLHTIHGRDVKNMTVRGFKGFAFNSKYFHDQLRRIAQGSKVFSINTENIKSCYLYIPTAAEQQKIVGLLICIQDKIDVVEQELHQYESQKQFLLKEMFI